MWFCIRNFMSTKVLPVVCWLESIIYHSVVWHVTSLQSGAERRHLIIASLGGEEYWWCYAVWMYSGSSYLRLRHYRSDCVINCNIGASVGANGLPSLVSAYTEHAWVWWVPPSVLHALFFLSFWQLPNKQPEKLDRQWTVTSIASAALPSVCSCR